MHPFYEDFVSYLNQENKEKCVEFVLSKLSKGEIDVVTLYTQVLTPSLNEMFCKDKQREVCIWEEHVRTSIVRTVMECCYPYLIEERNKRLKQSTKGKVIVVCPTEEYHEIGARMVADIFTLSGFDVVFVGANTPQDDILEAISYVMPLYVVISVTNYYNLVAAKRTITKILDTRNSSGHDFKIIVGGHAFNRNADIYKEMGADLHLHTFEDILALAEE